VTNTESETEHDTRIGGWQPAPLNALQDLAACHHIRASEYDFAAPHTIHCTPDSEILDSMLGNAKATSREGS
jgi:hypothetical protein